MTTPEAPKPANPDQGTATRPVLYRFSPEFRQEVSDLTAVALERARPYGDKSDLEAFQAYIWRCSVLAGTICRIESPLVLVGADPINTLWFELHNKGRLPGTSSIEQGLRRPEPGNARPYGLVEYTTEGVVVENEKGSTLVEKYIRIMAKKDWNDPVQRGEGYEDLLRAVLTPAKKGWQNPFPLPDYNAHLR